VSPPTEENTKEKEKKEKSIKHKYGTYNNILLSDESGRAL
jgi:hypothetical protein